MMDWKEVIWLLHWASTCVMVGIIWFVQLVHYPLFKLVSVKDFKRHHTQHMARSGLLIAPLMVTEMITGMLILGGLTYTSGFLEVDQQGFIISMVLLWGIWLSTFLVQVRYHRKLDHGKCERAIARLILTNWMRTFMWSGRVFILAVVSNN